MIATPTQDPVILCVAVMSIVMDTMWVTTVMVQLLATASNVPNILMQMRTSMVAANVTSSGKDSPVKPTMPHAIQFVLAVTDAQHAIAKSVWSTRM